MNHLVIMSDEYMAGALSCAGHPVVRTPNLDRLAGRGVRFEHAYTPSPMCVPARGAFQAGLRVDQVGCWSSAEPYHGSPPGWGTTLRERGVSVASVGKLHFRSSGDDNGFAPEMLPLHVAEGVGWLPGLLRRNPPPFDSSGFAGSAGEGGSAYSDYDRRICERAVDWLRHAPDRPWVLFVSFVCPHYPLRCPPAFFPDPEAVDMPLCYAESERPAHPVVRALMEASGYDRHFTGERPVRLARAAYYGLCGYVDDLVGRLLGVLERTGLGRDTRIVFTADHGEMLGNHGAWTKMLMYEDSVSVPMILAGPDLPRGEVNPTPVTLLDVPAMLLRDHGCEPTPASGGESLADLSLLRCPGRVALSQYHDGWSITGCFMLRWDHWKFIHYEGYEPQLFDLARDPEEREDLAARGTHRDVVGAGRRKLRAMLDPAEVTRRAFADQRALIERHGGERGLLDRMHLYFDYTPMSPEAAGPGAAGAR